MDPSEEGEPTLSFEGLEQPPIVAEREAGKLFILHADTLESLSVGSPVTHRQIQVGQVVGYELAPEEKGVTIHVFIESPYDAMVRPETRFWVSSGLELKLTADGLDVNTQSVASLVVGAISFETPDSLHPSGSAPENTEFELFRSRETMANREFVEKEQYVLFFKGSVRGLSVGAPVEFRGIRIGQVTDLNLQFNSETYRFDIPVMVEIEPGRIEILGDDLPENENGGVIGQLVEKGLRGQLKTGSLLTGQLFVDLDFQEETAPVTLARQGDFWIIPTVPTPLDALANRLKAFLAQVETWPIEQLGADVGEAIRSLKTLMASEDLQQSLDHIEKTLNNLEAATRRLNRELLPQAEGVIGKAGDLVERNAPLYLDLKQLLQEVSAAARAVRSTADYLGRHPESLIRGK
jgi:paraquat-inducible protein B